MAKAFAEPEGYEYQFDNVVSNYAQAEKNHYERLKKWCKENTDSKSPLVGETIQFSVADGSAVYMVFSTSPLHLIHSSYGDGYQAHDALIRGLRVSDVKEQVERAKTMAKLFKNNS